MMDGSPDSTQKGSALSLTNADGNMLLAPNMDVPGDIN